MKSHEDIVNKIAQTKGCQLILPGLERIGDAIEETWFVRDEPPPTSVDPGTVNESRLLLSAPAPEWYFLAGRFSAEHGRRGVRPLYVRLRPDVLQRIKDSGQCTGPINDVAVYKGGWPDPYALLMAACDRYTDSVFLALIDYDDYKAWEDRQYARLPDGGLLHVDTAG